METPPPKKVPLWLYFIAIKMILFVLVIAFLI
jgi:hypothetical protein